MEELEDLLKEEALTYRYQASFIRHFASIRDLDKEFPIEKEIDMHLDGCKKYYELYGTKDGKSTPWLTGRRK